MGEVVYVGVYDVETRSYAKWDYPKNGSKGKKLHGGFRGASEGKKLHGSKGKKFRGAPPKKQFIQKSYMVVFEEDETKPKTRFRTIPEEETLAEILEFDMTRTHGDYYRVKFSSSDSADYYPSGIREHWVKPWQMRKVNN